MCGVSYMCDVMIESALAKGLEVGGWCGLLIRFAGRGSRWYLGEHERKG